MGQIKSAGLLKRADGFWHIDKQINRRRICKNTGTSELKKAEEVLARIVEDERQARIFGVRPQRTFQQSADKYIQENQYLRSIKTNTNRLKQVLPFIADIYNSSFGVKI